jgi:hypothetical protein
MPKIAAMEGKKSGQDPREKEKEKEKAFEVGCL